MFDGSAYSMGGNGIYEAHNCTNAIASTETPPLNCIPPGEGGGCVETGPFKKFAFDPVSIGLY
jgi:tyrosinase